MAKKKSTKSSEGALVGQDSFFGDEGPRPNAAEGIDPPATALQSASNKVAARKEEHKRKLSERSRSTGGTAVTVCIY